MNKTLIGVKIKSDKKDFDPSHLDGIMIPSIPIPFSILFPCTKLTLKVTPTHQMKTLPCSSSPKLIEKQILIPK